MHASRTVLSAFGRMKCGVALYPFRSHPNAARRSGTGTQPSVVPHQPPSKSWHELSVGGMKIFAFAEGLFSEWHGLVRESL